MRFLPLLCFVFISSTSLAQNNLAALSYYQLIKNEQKNIGREIYFFKNSVSDLNLKLLTFQIKKSIGIVDSLPAYNNETIFKKAAVAQFRYFLSVSEKQYVQLLKYVEDPELENKEYIAKVKALFKEISDNEKPYDQTFNTAEDAYMLKYGIKPE